MATTRRQFSREFTLEAVRLTTESGKQKDAPALRQQMWIPAASQVATRNCSGYDVRMSGCVRNVTSL
jgi:transposase-like protein